MRTPDATPRRGTGTAVTLTRKNSTTEHNPAPTTERGKRRAARRGADAMLDMAYAANVKKLEEFSGVSE